MSIPNRRPVMSQKAVLTVTLIHGTLLTGALVLRNTLAPPLSMCERGLSQAWSRAEKGDLDGALAVAQATHGRMLQMHGAASELTSVAGQVVAELHRRRGEPARAAAEYRSLVAALPGHTPGDPGWIEGTGAVGDPGPRSVRCRPEKWGDPWTIELPSLAAGYHRAVHEAEVPSASSPAPARGFRP